MSNTIMRRMFAFVFILMFPASVLAQTAATDARERVAANRDYNVLMARRQIALMKEADEADLAFGQALLKTPQPPVEEMQVLIFKARQAAKAVADGWARIDELHKVQGKRTSREKLLSDMLGTK